MKYIIAKTHKDKPDVAYYTGDVDGKDSYSAWRHCAKKLNLSEAQDLIFDIYARRLERNLQLRIEEIAQEPQCYITKQYVIYRLFKDNTRDYYAGCTEDKYSEFTKDLHKAKLFSLDSVSDKLIILMENQTELCMKSAFKLRVAAYADLAQNRQYFITRYFKGAHLEYYAGDKDNIPVWSDYTKSAQISNFETCSAIMERLRILDTGLNMTPELELVEYL